MIYFILGVNSACVLKGAIPSNKLKLVLAWSELHKQELKNSWNQAKNMELPAKIDPLK